MSIYKRFISHLLILCTILGVLSPAADASVIGDLTGQKPGQSKVNVVNAENSAPDPADTSLSGEADIESALVKPLITYEGHTYTLFDGTASSWDMAEEYCESLGGHLATITSAEENAFLYTYMRNCGYSNAYWGLTDCAVEGVWEWCTGEPVTYTNWASGEPNDDYDGTEDYGMFWDEKPNGYWNDGVFGHDGQAFLCEWDCVLPEAANVYNGHVYLLVDTDVSSWEDAQAYCESLGGHLATITSAEENAFIYSYIVECGHRNAYFGLTDQNNEGIWEWCNGEPVSYTNWPQDQPSDNVGEENYGMYWDHYTNGEWNDGSFKNDHPFICEWDTIHNTHNTHDTIDQLTELDYLAFSKLAYSDLNQDLDSSVRDIIGDKWDKAWVDGSATDFTNSDIYGGIANWKLIGTHEGKDGFYAATFVSQTFEAVIAYRGSENFLNSLSSLDAFSDWWLNDFPIIFNGLLGTQFPKARKAYDDASANEDIIRIAVTGHSLGGAWANVISALYGCKGVSFNAVPAIDAAYDQKTELFAERFSGTGDWNFVDHANILDVMAGMNEQTFSSAPLKPYIAHKSMYTGINPFTPHSMWPLVERKADGSVGLTKRIAESIPTVAMTQQRLISAVTLGSTNNDSFRSGLSSWKRHTFLGGDGYDSVIAGIFNDQIAGGDQNDFMDGDWGDDTYIYYKGDGSDDIRDIGGDDRLILMGFDENDVIEIKDDEAISSIFITCNGEEIISIYKAGREYDWVTTDSFKVSIDHGSGSPDIVDITSYFKPTKYGSRILVQCPVDVEVVDENGTVVFILKDGEAGDYYTDYGYFHVFEEENGGFGKVLNLAEGYTAHITGVDEGTMDVTYQVPVEGELTEPVSVSDVPVTEDLVATIEENEEGDVYLLIDEDGDGKTDSEQKLYGECPFTDVPEDSFYYTPVLWAVDEGITTGATETTFDPYGQCLRAQVVTFLWRAAGCPEPVTAVNPFMDVKESDFYYKAVLWAVEKGITNGLDATHFGPFDYCNRAQVVTFLYRAMERPEVSTTECAFTDVEAGAWYETPVLWAVENHVTNGMDAATFGVNTICNRAQVVTFLYRAFEQ